MRHNRHVISAYDCKAVTKVTLLCNAVSSYYDCVMRFTASTIQLRALDELDQRPTLHGRDSNPVWWSQIRSGPDSAHSFRS